MRIQIISYNISSKRRNNNTEHQQKQQEAPAPPTTQNRAHTNHNNLAYQFHDFFFFVCFLVPFSVSFYQFNSLLNNPLAKRLCSQYLSMDFLSFAILSFSFSFCLFFSLFISFILFKCSIIIIIDHRKARQCDALSLLRVRICGVVRVTLRCFVYFNLFAILELFTTIVDIIGQITLPIIIIGSP